MEKPISQTQPLARKEGLVVQKLPDEVLVYDLDAHKAHCLNQTAALVWEQCDGNKSVSDIAHRIGTELNAKVNDDVVFLALDQLGKDNLLEKRVALPIDMTQISRRELLRRVGLATAVALPVIISIMSPTAANAVTCIPSGAACSPTVVCCSTLATCGVGTCP